MDYSGSKFCVQLIYWQVYVKIKEKSKIGIKFMKEPLRVLNGKYL